jgi:hypothetical protein
MEFVAPFTRLSLSLIVIAASFQDSEDNSGSETDDEEMEARKVAQDDEMILVD